MRHISSIPRLCKGDLESSSFFFFSKQNDKCLREITVTHSLRQNSQQFAISLAIQNAIELSIRLLIKKQVVPGNYKCGRRVLSA